MLEARYCPYCKKYMGIGHGYQVSTLKIRHFQKEHPKELKEWEKQKEKLSKLSNKYGLWNY